MTVYALQLQVLAVEEEALFWVEPIPAEAQRARRIVCNAAIRLEAEGDAVEIRTVGRPQFRIENRRSLLFDEQGLAGRQRLNCDAIAIGSDSPGPRISVTTSHVLDVWPSLRTSISKAATASESDTLGVVTRVVTMCTGSVVIKKTSRCRPPIKLKSISWGGTSRRQRLSTRAAIRCLPPGLTRWVTSNSKGVQGAFVFGRAVRRRARPWRPCRPPRSGARSVCRSNSRARRLSWRYQPMPRVVARLVVEGVLDVPPCGEDRRFASRRRTGSRGFRRRRRPARWNCQPLERSCVRRALGLGRGRRSPKSETDDNEQKQFLLRENGSYEPSF